VDLEGLYAPGMPQPEVLTSGSAGYAHRTAKEGLWGPRADRFAGAVLLAEMLGFCDEGVCQASWGESYFDPQEMQQETPRYRTLVAALERRWGSNVARLFERAWRSDSLLDCPTFGEWLVAMPEHPVAQAFSLSTAATETAEAQASTSPEEVTLGVVRGLMQAARRMEDKGNLEGALELYRQALELAQADPSLRSLAREIELTVQDVEKRVAAQPSRPQPAISPRPVEEGPGGRAISPLPPGVPFGDDKGPGVRAEPRRKPGWGFWLLWVLASTAGWAVGRAVGWAVSGAVVGAAVGAMGLAVGLAVGKAVGGAVAGAVTGVAQWLLLRRQVRRAGWWILASAAGWAVGGAVGDAVFRAVGDAVFRAVVGAVGSAVRFAVLLAVGDAVVGAVAGAVAGVAQWLLLRRQVRRAGWWILASAAGWAVGWAVGLAMGNAVGLAMGNAVAWAVSGAVSGAVIGAVSGAVSGIITGAALVWLLRQPRPETKGDAQ